MHFRHKFISCKEKLVYYFSHFISCVNLFNTIKTEEDLLKGFYLKGVFIPKLPNNLLASCSLTNFNFLLSHTAHFDKSIFFSRLQTIR